jgi:hypothetical protein
MNPTTSLLIVACALLAAGCTHVAKVEDLPASASDVPFDRASQMAPRGEVLWQQDTKFEHYIELSPTSHDALHKRLEESFGRAGYQVVRNDKAQGTLVGSRGMTLMEWGSVGAIYYRPQAERVQVVVRVHITQDITGSPRHNPAWDVGDEVCREIGFCKVRK